MAVSDTEQNKAILTPMDRTYCWIYFKANKTVFIAPNFTIHSNNDTASCLHLFLVMELKTEIKNWKTYNDSDLLIWTAIMFLLTAYYTN